MESEPYGMQVKEAPAPEVALQVQTGLRVAVYPDRVVVYTDRPVEVVCAR